MPKFKFRLAALKRVREIDRDAARRRLAQAQTAEQILDQQRLSLEDEASQQRSVLRQLCATDELDVNQVLQTQRYQLAIGSQKDDLQSQLEQVRQEVERRRQTAVEADRQVRVLEKLEERQHAEHRRQQAARETQRLDEVAGTRHAGDRR